MSKDIIHAAVTRGTSTTRADNVPLSQAELAEQLKQLNWVQRVTKTEPCDEVDNADKKICPMPSCKNEVRRGRYCNSCQKRKESLNRTLAQQGIHLPTQRRVRHSTSIDNLTSLAQTPNFVVGKHVSPYTRF